MKRFSILALTSVLVFALSAFMTSCGGGGGAAVGGNSAPVANAGTDQSVTTGAVVALNGSSSTDADGNTLTYTWSFTSKPATSAAATPTATVAPTFTADLDGAYVLSLVVNDGTINSVADTITITAATPFIGSATFKMSDTGQATCYDSAGDTAACAGTGQDGLYSLNTPSYTDNTDGTITDNVTGLMWQKCSNGQSGTSCATGTATTYNWYKAAGITDDTYNHFIGAINVCGDLTLAGQDDWRLPSRIEVISLIDNGTSSPAIDNTYFEGTQSAYYWSSTVNASDSTKAWFGLFFQGTADNDSKTNLNYVRCVRGGQ